jgi:hypothetical protein
MSDHAISNARSWLQTIVELRDQMRAAQNEANWDALDAARDEIQDSALSVEVRSGWYSLSDKPEPEEYRILLTTGGPGLQIRGRLDGDQTPRLQWQDWFVPWTDLELTDDEQSAVAEFTAQFYFGEG